MVALVQVQAAAPTDRAAAVVMAAVWRVVATAQATVALVVAPVVAPVVEEMVREAAVPILVTVAERQAVVMVVRVAVIRRPRWSPVRSSAKSAIPFPGWAMVSATWVR